MQRYSRNNRQIDAVSNGWHHLAEKASPLYGSRLAICVLVLPIVLMGKRALKRACKLSSQNARKFASRAGRSVESKSFGERAQNYHQDQQRAGWTMIKSPWWKMCIKIYTLDCRMIFIQKTRKERSKFKNFKCILITFLILQRNNHCL